MVFLLLSLPPLQCLTTVPVGSGNHCSDCISPSFLLQLLCCHSGSSITITAKLSRPPSRSPWSLWLHLFRSCRSHGSSPGLHFCDSICQLLHVASPTLPFSASSSAHSTNVSYQKQSRQSLLGEAFLLCLGLPSQRGYTDMCLLVSFVKLSSLAARNRAQAPITEDLHANEGPCLHQSWLCPFCTSHNCPLPLLGAPSRNCSLLPG